jgi:hypothetical protein
LVQRHARNNDAGKSSNDATFYRESHVLNTLLRNLGMGIWHHAWLLLQDAVRAAFYESLNAG